MSERRLFLGSCGPGATIYFLSVHCLSVATAALSLFGLRLHNKILCICDSSGYVSRLLLQVFLDNIETFITQLDSTNHINLFLTELRSDSLIGQSSRRPHPDEGKRFLGCSPSQACL